MASQDACIAKFAGQQVCIDRSYSRLLAWAAYTSALPLPPTDATPPAPQTRQRILAEKTPVMASTYAAQLGPFLLEEPVITQKVRQHLSEWNDDAVETTLVADIDTAFAAVMPRFADMMITDQDVSTWLARNGYPPQGVAP